jgi:hypothetical protein
MNYIRTASHLHLGDNIYNIILFRKLVDLYNRDIKFCHYVNRQYIPELRNFIRGYEKHIVLKDFNTYIKTDLLKTECNDWFISYDDIVFAHRQDINSQKNLACLLYGDDSHWSENHPDKEPLRSSEYFDEVVFNCYIQYCDFMNLECPFKSAEETLIDFNELLVPNKLTDSYDLLIANNRPMSSQWSDGNKVFNYLIERIDLKKVKVISLEPTGYEEIPSTIQNGLNLLEVGNIAINSKIIIGVHSSPYTTMINKFNCKTVHEFVVLQNGEQRWRYKSGKSLNFQSYEDFVNGWRIPINWCKI